MAADVARDNVLYLGEVLREFQHGCEAYVDQQSYQYDFIVTSCGLVLKF